MATVFELSYGQHLDALPAYVEIYADPARVESRALRRVRLSETATSMIPDDAR